MIKRLLSVFVFAFLGATLTLNAQSIGGVSLYTGVSAMYNKDPLINGGNLGQYGYLVGFDGRLNSGNLYFSIGGRYMVTSLIPEENMTFFSNEEDYKLGVIRLGFGFNLVNFNSRTRLRSKILGSAMIGINNPERRMNVDGYEVINDSWGGLVTGIGLDFGPLTADLEYHRGLVNVYNGQPDSRLDAYSFTVGIFF